MDDQLNTKDLPSRSYSIFLAFLGVTDFFRTKSSTSHVRDIQHEETMMNSQPTTEHMFEISRQEKAYINLSNEVPEVVNGNDKTRYEQG